MVPNQVGLQHGAKVGGGEAGVPLNPDGIPLWCVDLVPPKAELMKKAANDLTWVPLAVLYGDVQAMPSWICAIAHVSKLKQLVNASVLRFLPSGCAAWEHEGLEVSLTACPDFFLSRHRAWSRIVW